MAPITILARFGSFLFKLGPKFCYSWARSGVWSTTSDLSGNNRLYRNFLTVGLMRALTPANSSSVESLSATTHSCVSRCVCESRMPRRIGPHDCVLRFRSSTAYAFDRGVAIGFACSLIQISAIIQRLTASRRATSARFCRHLLLISIAQWSLL